MYYATNVTPLTSKLHFRLGDLKNSYDGYLLSMCSKVQGAECEKNRITEMKRNSGRE